VQGGTRRVPAPPEAVLLTGDAAAERAFAARMLDLAAEPPYGLFVRDNRLLLSLHHSVADGLGAVFLLDRLAAHYAARTGGPPAPPPPVAPSRRYGAYFWRLTAAERWRALKGMGRSLGEGGQGAPPAALFLDLPGPGRLAWRELLLDPGPLREAARAHGGTLNDLLLAATAVAGQRTWPQQLPVRLFMPTSLRSWEPDPTPVDLANRSADLEVTVPPLDDLWEAFAVVKAQTPAARDRAASFQRVFQRALASYVPPRLMRDAMQELHARPQNQVSSVFFSNVGDLGALPRDFGPLRVHAVGFLPPLLAPPGLAVLAATTRGRLLLTVCHLEPTVAAASAERFADALLRALRF
jgi:NRPS condensation-like uncharacterized protein